MGRWDRIRAALRREARDIAEAAEEARARANADLDRRERELHAPPDEKLEIERERAAAADAEFDEVRRRIEGDTRDR